MQKTAILVIFTCLAWIAPHALAEPNRESLISAWETYMAELPSTSAFEKTGENTYQLTDTELPYDGEIVMRGTLVRPIGVAGDTVFSHTGLLELELTDLPEERQSSQIYYYWITDKQMLYYSTGRDAWVNQAEYTTEFSDEYDYDVYGEGFGFMSFMMKYGIWLLLVVLIIFVFRGASVQMKKNRALMDETAAINEKARENVDRAQAMQDEVLAISRQSLELQAENNATLKNILEALRR